MKRNLLNETGSASSSGSGGNMKCAGLFYRVTIVSLCLAGLFVSFSAFALPSGGNMREVTTKK